MVDRTLIPRGRLAALGIAVGVALIGSGCAYRALLPIAGVDREQPDVAVKLKPVLLDGKPLRTGVPTEIRFLPGPGGKGSRILLVAEKRGTLKWVDLRTDETGFLLRIPNTGIDIEQGFVSFAIHPKWPEVREIFTHHQAAVGFGGRTVLTRWTIWGHTISAMTAQGEEIFAFDQPQGGHNGGQVAFGPDGMLYAAFGDGGWQGDPEDRAQDPTSYHGAMIRIDVDTREPGRGYSIPADNPFVDGGHLPEVWAFGFRNPWRFDFGPAGQLLLADVGQDRLEEIDLVVRGGNYGWSLKEGSLCYGVPRPDRGDCEQGDLVDPIYEYKRADGRAVIGGRFYGGKGEPLAGRYVFGDYSSGRLWALRPPTSAKPEVDVQFLGGFGIAPTCFGRDEHGDLYIGVQGGRLYKLVVGG